VRVPQVASLVPVRPFAHLEVIPDDFPFLQDIRGLDDARFAGVRAGNANRRTLA
jgi:hypothetical protein